MTDQPSDAVAEASNWCDVMAKLIEFYVRGPLAKKVNPIPIEERGKPVEFPKETFAAHSRTEDITERAEVSPFTVLFFWLFLRASMKGLWK